MVLRLAGAFLYVAAASAQAGDRTVETALAVALLDVVEEHCAAEVTVDDDRRAAVFTTFHDYDVQGWQSLIAGPLNRFYEDFLYDLARGREGFCRRAPAFAEASGHPGLLKLR
ncbi:MAG: hypothetical protein FJX63_00920 [Alphaproteobacteria bacterium]|nr:hypothetical protein [Alphaproteobacteria bacterium]